MNIKYKKIVPLILLTELFERLSELEEDKEFWCKKLKTKGLQFKEEVEKRLDNIDKSIYEDYEDAEALWRTLFKRMSSFIDTELFMYIDPKSIDARTYLNEHVGETHPIMQYAKQVSELMASYSSIYRATEQARIEELENQVKKYKERAERDWLDDKYPD